MPLYQQTLTILPKASPERLVELFKGYSKIIISSGGILRGIENHGLRDLPEKAKREYLTADGERYFWELRYVTSTFDVGPKTLIDLDRYLRTEDVVLRFFTLKSKFTIDLCRNNSFRNPYM